MVCDPNACSKFIACNHIKLTKVKNLFKQSKNLFLRHCNYWLCTKKSVFDGESYSYYLLKFRVRLGLVIYVST